MRLLLPIFHVDIRLITFLWKYLFEGRYLNLIRSALKLLFIELVLIQNLSLSHLCRFVQKLLSYRLFRFLRPGMSQRGRIPPYWLNPNVINSYLFLTMFMYAYIVYQCVTMTCVGFWCILCSFIPTTCDVLIDTHCMFIILINCFIISLTTCSAFTWLFLLLCLSVWRYLQISTKAEKTVQLWEWSDIVL